MEQIITLQIRKKDTTPANDYDWRQILNITDGESVDILDHWVIRTGTVSPELPVDEDSD